MSRYVILTNDNLTVINIIMADSTMGLNAYLITDTTAVGPGYTVVDLPSLTFAPPALAPLPLRTSVEIEVDFGATPTPQVTFALTSDQVVPSTRITAELSGDAATGRAAGDAAWDSVSIAAEAGTGTYNLYAVCTTGRLAGARKIVVTFDNT